MKITKNKPLNYLINLVAIVLLYVIIMLLVNYKIINKYYARMLIPVGFNIILAVSLNLSAGFLGQLPLGHAGFMSLGAYSAALFTLNVNLPQYIEFPLALIIGGLVAGVFGIIIGLPALRLSGDYLAIITLGFGEIIRVIMLNLKITGGSFGLKRIPQYTSITNIYICVVITIFVIYTLIKSRHGRAILAIREDEIAAEASGISTTYYKTFAFALSAAFAGVAGGLYGHYLSILDPNNFGFMKSVEILVMVVLGGLGSIIGSIVSAGILTFISELLRELADYRMVIYSLLLIIVMIFKPSGLFGRYDFSLGKTLDGIFSFIRSKIFRKPSNEVKKGGK